MAFPLDLDLDLNLGFGSGCGFGSGIESGSGIRIWIGIWILIWIWIWIWIYIWLNLGLESESRSRILNLQKNERLLDMCYMCLEIANKVLAQLGMTFPHRPMHAVFNQELQRGQQYVYNRE